MIVMKARCKMFNDSDNGQTQYCKECQKWVEKYEKLEKENERLKQGIKHYQRGMYKIISVATECRNSKQWNYDIKQV